MVLDASIDDLAAEGPLTGPNEHLGRRGSRRKSFLQHSGKAVSPVGSPGAAHAFLQGLADRMLIDHELRVTSANVLGNPDPIVAPTPSMI